ncbi:MAG: lipase family protein [Chloroflexota bacterium]
MNYSRALVCAKLAQEVYGDLDTIKFSGFPNSTPEIFENKGTDTQSVILPVPENDAVYIIFRGTENIRDWRTNIIFSRDLFTFENTSDDPMNLLEDTVSPAEDVAQLEAIRPAEGRTDLAPDAPLAKMHNGFVRAYQSVQDGLHQYIRQYNPGSITVTGHSLGGALATLCAIDFQLSYEGKWPIEIFTFGSPRVGNPQFRDLFDANISRSYRMVNGLDIVPGLPRWWNGYRHVNTVDHIGRHFTYKFITGRVSHHLMTDYIHELEALV